MNDQLEPDLDDTVETLIAKGFTRVKATKLFYENQKIKAQQKHDQPLYHVDVCFVFYYTYSAMYDCF